MVLPADQSTTWKKYALGYIAVGTLLRLVLAYISIGSNDAVTWYAFAIATRALGTVRYYQMDSTMNHPLLPIYWAQLANSIGGGAWFPFIFKLPFIAADGVSAWLAASFAQLFFQRGGAAAAAAVALSPILILISAYHGNDDCGYAMLVLLSAGLLMRRRFFYGGLALGAAINIKLVPVLLIPMAFAGCRSWREVGHLFLALLACVIPFLPLLVHPEIVGRNMLQYNGWQERWGVVGFAKELQELPQFLNLGKRLEAGYLVVGRVLVLGSILLIAALNLWARRWSAIRLYAVACVIFLVFGSGFGLQYLALPVPLLAVLDWTIAWSFSVIAGSFALLAYGAFLQKGYPLMSQFEYTIPHAAAVFGWLTWGLLVQVGSRLTFRPTPTVYTLTP